MFNVKDYFEVESRCMRIRKNNGARSNFSYQEAAQIADYIKGIYDEGSNVSFDLYEGGPLELFGHLDGGVTGNIIGMNVYTDCFDDYAKLYEYSGLEVLTLTSRGESFDATDLQEMQLAIVNLQHLKRVTINVSGVSDEEFENIQACIHFPCSSFEFSLNQCSKNGRKKRKK